VILDVPQFERPLSLTERGRDSLRRGRIISIARAREIAMGILAGIECRSWMEQAARWKAESDALADDELQPVYDYDIHAG